ncbi:esterase YqiA [Vibrio ostreicida]|nr:esterase YqiA [Vibrio ostreicida]
MMPSLVLIYIHGFNSSPLSHKASVMSEYCQRHRPDIDLLIPQLPCFPQLAADYLRNIIRNYGANDKIGLIGSSLGGYMSMWLNTQFGCKAVVINPAVKPYELLVDYLGPQKNPYTQQCYELENKHIGELKALDTPTLADPADFWLLQQTGDEVLDYREAITKFSGSKQTVEPGGDHSFVGFERYPKSIIEFLGL